MDRESDWHNLVCSLMTALNDLQNGHSFRETGVDIERLRKEAESLGVDVSHIFNDDGE